MSTPLQLTLFGPAGYAGQVQRSELTVRPAVVRGRDGQFVPNVRCEKCDGTGIFRWAGRVENGVYIGKQGTCYACKGKGRQTRSDERRNEFYWDHVALSAF